MNRHRRKYPAHQFRINAQTGATGECVCRNMGGWYWGYCHIVSQQASNKYKGTPYD